MASSSHDSRLVNPRSEIFSSLVVKPQETADLYIRARDNLYKNHFIKKKEEASDFVTKITFEATGEDVGKGIACALITLRNSDFFLKFYDTIFSPASDTKRAGNIQGMVYMYLQHIVRKCFLDFSPTPIQNALLLQRYLCKIQSEPLPILTELTKLIIASIDTGTLNQLNHDLIRHFLKNIKSFPKIWPRLGICIPAILIKLLRSYQDTKVISKQFNQNKSPQRKPNQIPLNQESSTLRNEDLIQKFTDIWSASNIQLINQFFEDVFCKLDPRWLKEIVRILYDPRTYDNEMQAAFSPIYEKISKCEPSIYPDSNLVQIMLPYAHLKELLNEINQNNNNSTIYPPFLKRNHLYDVDLVLSDVFRCFLQNNDFDSLVERRSSFIKRMIEIVMNNRVNPVSTLHSIISDFFCIKINDLENAQKQILLMVDPGISLLKSTSKPSISSTIVEIMMVRLRQPDNYKYKRKSVRELFAFYRNTKEIDIPGLIMKIPSLSSEIKQQFDRFIHSDDSDSDTDSSIPQTSNQPSPEKFEAIRKANAQIRLLFDQSGGNWSKVLNPDIQKIFDRLIPYPRNDFEAALAFDIHVVTFCMGNSKEDAEKFMDYIAQNKKYDQFNDALKYVDLANYGEILNNRIREKISHSTHEFLLKCISFRANRSVLYNICEYCPMSIIIELAELPYLDLDPKNLDIQLSTTMSNDGQSKFAYLISGRVTTPNDLEHITDGIVRNFDHLPSSLISVFQNMMMLKQHPSYSKLFAQINKLGTSKANEFCQIVSKAWREMQHPRTATNIESLLPSTT